MEYRENIYEGGPVHVDGNVYIGCRFLRCSLVYSGGSLPSFTECFFDHCTFQLEGAADRTMFFLRMLFVLGGEGVIASVMDIVREPIPSFTGNKHE